MQTVIDQLASSHGRKDEVLNQELAGSIVRETDQATIDELVKLLFHKNKDIQSDVIKVLYEIGELNPSLISAYAEVFLDLLDHKNTRLVWGAMTALDSITHLRCSFVHANLPGIIAASDRGSVIAKDHLIGILIKLAGTADYALDALSLLLEQMQTCATNQLPMYAENSLRVINSDFKMAFVNVLSSRLGEIEKESKRKRVEKIISRLSK